MQAGVDVVLALETALGVLTPVRDIVEGRVDVDETPTWCVRRKWDSYLRSLSDDELAACERDGLHHHVGGDTRAPPDLCALAEGVTALAMPFAPPATRSLEVSALRSMPARKQRQVEALVAACRPLSSRALRIVEVGAGRGHFSRLAASVLDLPTLGIEIDRAKVAAADAIASQAPLPRRAPSYRALDALSEPLDLAPDDLVVGLHACGDVGEALLRAAATARSTVALVSCCLQKIAGASRPPLSAAAERSGFDLPRDVLGLTNLTQRAEGVEASLAATLRARETRAALRLLLRGRGLDVALGEEMRGVNRRRAYRGIEDIARRSLASRGLSPPTPSELARCEEAARERFALVRRLSLPRAMLARAVELGVVLDRACFLVERGFDVSVVPLFELEASPRNLAILGAPSRH